MQTVRECTVLCVGKGELKKTSKFILAVMLGKEFVTNWVIDSVKQGELQSTEQYLTRDPAREEVWGDSLKEAVERETQGIKAFQDLEYPSYYVGKEGGGKERLLRNR